MGGCLRNIHVATVDLLPPEYACSLLWPQGTTAMMSVQLIFYVYIFNKNNNFIYRFTASCGQECDPLLTFA